MILTILVTGKPAEPLHYKWNYINAKDLSIEYLPNSSAFVQVQRASMVEPSIDEQILRTGTEQSDAKNHLNHSSYHKKDAK